MVRAMAGYCGSTLWISAASITPSLRLMGVLRSGGAGFLISMGMPVLSAPGIPIPGPAAPSIPTSLIPGADSPLDVLPSFSERACVGAAGLVQKRQSAGLSVILTGGSGRD